jgi:hypothetical protein
MHSPFNTTAEALHRQSIEIFGRFLVGFVELLVMFGRA